MAASVLLVVFMMWFVPWATQTLGPAMGYATVFLVYWFGFCLPLGLFFQGRRAALRNLRFGTGAAPWVPLAIACQVVVIAVANYVLWPAHVTVGAICLAGAAALINGFSEEFFWRGAYLELGRGNPVFQSLGVLLFGLWHVPLMFAQGVDYQGGAVALIFGAWGLGAFWAVVASRTDGIGWPIVAHIVSNVFAFTGVVALSFV
ncbi:MAG: CPBP family glutamic-type intramembrane protease [Sulfitobacter sp.]